MTSVFISHNWKDKALARKIASSLNQYGIETWIDEAEIKIGDSLIEKIRDGLNKVDYVIALVSPHSVESEWVKKELDIAMNSEIEGKRVVVLPILAGKCDLPGFLKGKLYADMSATKLFVNGISQLLSRFEIEKVFPDEIVVFTSKKITVAEVIKNLQSSNIDERINIWESFNYSDHKIFSIEVFLTFYNERLTEPKTEENEIHSMLNLLGKFSEKNIKSIISKLKFVPFLIHQNEKIIIKTIEILINHKINDEEIVEILLSFLTDNSGKIGRKTKRKAQEYFCKVKIYDEFLQEEIIDFCNSQLTVEKSKNEIITLILIMLIQLADDSVISRMQKLCENSEDMGAYFIAAISLLHERYDNSFHGFHIRSRRLMDWFKNFITSSFKDNDYQNANVICVLIASSESYPTVFSMDEIWKIISGLDEYSIEATLNEISIWFNISYVFSNNSDVDCLQNLLKKGNKKINDLIFDLLANIQLKSAIDILAKNSYIPQYHNDTDIIVTIMKETNIVEYKELYTSARNVALGEYSNEIDILLTAICDYMLNEISEEKFIKIFNTTTPKTNSSFRNYSENLKFICEFLEDKFKDKEQVRKSIEKFIKTVKKKQLNKTNIDTDD